MTKEELKQRFEKEIGTPNDYFNHRGGLMNEVFNWFWPEIESRDNRIKELEELESQLSKQKELLQETINERNDWVGKYQKERELREAADKVIEKTIAYLESISGKEINYSRFLFDSGNSAYMKYNNLKNQGLIPDAEPALKRNLF